MRTSLRTCWRTIGHDDLDLRLRRALAHGSFDTSSIFHRTGVGNTRPPLPAATRSSVPCTLFQYSNELQYLYLDRRRILFPQDVSPRWFFCLFVPITSIRGETFQVKLLLWFTHKIDCCDVDFCEISIDDRSDFRSARLRVLGEEQSERFVDLSSRFARNDDLIELQNRKIVGARSARDPDDLGSIFSNNSQLHRLYWLLRLFQRRQSDMKISDGG